MRAASSRIWSPTTTIQPTHQFNHPEEIDDPSVGINQPVTEMHVGLSERSDPLSKRISENLVPTGSGDPLIDGFAKLVTDRVHEGWSCDLVTFLFHELPGPRGAVIGRMRDEVERVYSTLVTRVHPPNRHEANEAGLASLAAYYLIVFMLKAHGCPATIRPPGPSLGRKHRHGTAADIARSANRGL
jgi:hypothetical protein